MTRELDPLLERIDRAVEECDARALPPLTSGTAAAELDLAEQAGSEATYVGFDEEVEPRADHMSGWLARVFGRWWG